MSSNDKPILERYTYQIIAIVVGVFVLLLFVKEADYLKHGYTIEVT